MILMNLIGILELQISLPKELVNRLNSVTNEQISEMVEPLVWEKGKEHSPGNFRRLSKILSRDAVYMEAGSHPTILESLEGLLGPNIALLTNKHNHIMVRPPGSEFVYWHSGEEPYNYTLITALIYLEESTLENGCVRIVPGSHMRPFRRSRRPSESFLESDLYNRSLPVPMPRGPGRPSEFALIGPARAKGVARPPGARASNRSAVTTRGGGA